MIKEQNVDILLSDIQMPFLNGIELTSQAKALCPDLEVLFFSGYDDFEYVQNALLLHAVNYILKPVNPENFCSSLQEIICRLDSHEIRFANSNQYIQQNFYDQTSWDSSGSYDSTLADDFLLKNIDLAIQLKQIAQLQSLVDELLHKYSAPARQSHIYIRHIATCLLRILMAPIRNLNESDFDAAAGEIYLFRHFSDIEKSVRKYLNLLVVQLKEEVETPSYAVHLVKQYIETHYAQDLTLNFLAEQVYLNPNYLSNVFTKVTGCNISKYVKHVRMKKAQELLRATQIRKLQTLGQPSVIPIHLIL